MVLRHAPTVAVHEPQSELGIGTPLLGKRCQFPQSGCLVAALGSFQPLLEISAPAGPGTSHQQSDGKADGGG